MKERKAAGFLISATFACGILLSPIMLSGEGTFYVTEKGAQMWEAASCGWKMGGIGRERMEIIRWAIENKPPDVQELKGWEVMAREPGEWLAFGVKFGRVQRLIFTKDTKIIVIDKQGNRYESQALLFWPDEWQSEVYDTRKTPVVVTNKTIYCRPLDGSACLKAKFATDVFRVKDIVKYEVVGAIEDTSRQGGDERRW